MLEYIKTGLDRLFLVLIIRPNFPIDFAKIELYSFFSAKQKLSTSVMSF